MSRRRKSVSRRPPHIKAAKVAKWAKIMTKWLISYSTVKRNRWRFVEFSGPSGAESRGIVDFIAVRKNHRLELGRIRRGDLLEIIIVQTKGGKAPLPSKEDRHRLMNTKRHHRARDVMLAVWENRGIKPSIFRLLRDRWVPVEASAFFK